tara:strand:- start:74 stop:1066 length:993 start_codon:yes stop_codon:yes gene_type:complete
LIFEGKSLISQQLKQVEVLNQPQKRRGHFRRAMSRLARKKIALLSFVIILVIYLAGIMAPWISPYDYNQTDLLNAKMGPSLSHFAGTDLTGRDVFTRVLWGVQNTVILTFISMLTGSLVIGISFGLISGYFGGKIDTIINRTGEIFASFPTFFLLVLIAASLRPRFTTWAYWLDDHTFLEGVASSGVVDYFVISLSLVSFSWFGMSRVVRGQTLTLKSRQFVEASIAMGASTPRILVRHILPNAISPVVVLVTMGMGSMVGAEILLSWLGLGIQPPRPSLGRMLLEGGSISTLRQWPWLLLAPGSVAWILVLCWNLLGDALNDVLNPRTR